MGRITHTQKIGHSREKHALERGHILILTGWPFFPPVAQQAQNIDRQHDVAILAPLRLHDADDLFIAINITNLEPHDLARTHPAAISQRQHHARLKVWGYRKDADDLLFAQDQRHLHRLFKVENLSHEIMTPKGHTEQEFNARHGLFARADADAALHQMLLEILHVIRRRCLRRPPEPSRKPLAGAQVATLGRRADCALAYPRSCGHEAVSSGWCVECSWENPLSIEAKSPQPTAHTQLHKTRNKSHLSTTPKTSAISRSDLVLEPLLTDVVTSIKGGFDEMRQSGAIVIGSLG
jgi:hypothetical protein